MGGESGKEFDEALDIIGTLLGVIEVKVWRARLSQVEKRQIIAFLNRHKMTTKHEV